MSDTITIEVADLLQKQYINQSIAIIIIAIGVAGTIRILLKPKKSLVALLSLAIGLFGFHSYMDAVYKIDNLRIKRCSTKCHSHLLQPKREAESSA